MRARALGLLLTIALATAPAAALAAGEKTAQKGARRATAVRVTKKVWRGVKRLPRRIHSVGRDAFSGGFGRIAVAAAAFGAFNVVSGNPKGLAFMAGALAMAGVNYGYIRAQR